jgi:hypothetical protein
MDDVNYAAMRAGVEGSHAVLAVITGPCVDNDSDATEPVENAYFSRPMCCNELRWARESEVPIIPIVRAEDKKKIWDFVQLAPEDLRDIINADFIHVDRCSRTDMEHGGRKVIERFKRVAPVESDVGPSDGSGNLIQARSPSPLPCCTVYLISSLPHIGLWQCRWYDTGHQGSDAASAFSRCKGPA